MFINSKHALQFTKHHLVQQMYRTNLHPLKGIGPQICMIQHVHKTAADKPLPIPGNIDPAETTRFSPQRTRDINANVIVSQFPQRAASNIDITADNSTNSMQSGNSQDPHIQSYDCNSAVSLNSSMQSNVPTPFGGMHKFTHLNMPGGQWSQESKFVSQYQHNSHYTVLRNNVRMNWGQNNKKTTGQQNVGSINNVHTIHTNAWQVIMQRKLSTKTDTNDQSTEHSIKPDETKSKTKKEQLKLAFKQYGATIVVFHVTISLASLGAFYLLVSSGIDLMPIIESLGLASSATSNKIATSASTFVVAYAIHKLFAPVRITITLSATPFIVRYLRSRGLLKDKSIK